MSANLSKPSISPQCPNCLQKTGSGKKVSGAFKVYFCDTCHNGFTYPVPQALAKYYYPRYWVSSNLIGKAKEFIFNVFQKRRTCWVIKSVPEGNILDVGSGEGTFAESLPSRYKTISLESSWAKIKNKKIIKADFLAWATKQKFDAICFWESLEHTPYPQKYLEKAYQLLKKKGVIFIEFPRYHCFESKFFGENWFHLDLPRHLTHLTDQGLIILLKRAGFKNAQVKNVFSLDYAPWGLAASLVNKFNHAVTDDIKKSKNFFLFLLLLPLTFLSCLFEIGLFLINQSPIGLATAEKNG